MTTQNIDNDLVFELGEESASTQRLPHGVNGMVFKPSEGRFILIANMKEDESPNAHPSGLKLDVFAIERVIAGVPRSKMRPNGSTAWVATNYDDGFKFEKEPKPAITNKTEYFAQVGNNNAGELLRFKKHPVLNAMMIQDGTMTEFPVCPGPQYTQDVYNKLNEYANGLLSMYKSWEAFKNGDPYVSYEAAGFAKQSVRRNDKQMKNQFNTFVNLYKEEFKRLVSIGALVTSAVIYAKPNGLTAVTHVTPDMPLGEGKARDIYADPRGYTTLKTTACLTVHGKMRVRPDLKTDPMHPDYDCGISTTSRNDGEYGTQRTRYMTELVSRNGTSVLVRTSMYGNMSVSRNGSSRPEILASAVEAGNNMLSLWSSNVLTFSPMFQLAEEDNANGQPWCMRTEITLDQYSIERDDKAIPVTGDIAASIESMVIDEEVVIDDDLNFDVQEIITPADATERQVSSSAVTEAKKARMAALASKGKKDDDDGTPDDSLNDGLVGDEPKFDPE